MDYKDEIINFLENKTRKVKSVRAGLFLIRGVDELHFNFNETIFGAPANSFYMAIYLKKELICEFWLDLKNIEKLSIERDMTSEYVVESLCLKCSDKSHGSYSIKIERRI